MRDRDTDALVRYRMEQAERSLHYASVLLAEAGYNASVNRSYYAMFYGALALLLLKNKGTSKHSGVMSIFDTDFVMPGVFERKFSKWIHEAFDLRNRADYEDFFDASQEEAALTLNHARGFVARVKQHLEQVFMSSETEPTQSSEHSTTRKDRVMRKFIIAGNWKMNCDRKEAAALASGLKKTIGSVEKVEAVLCPPFTDLAIVADAIAGSKIGLGAQNVYWEKSGAFTGEIAPGFLKELGCAYCIVGHSERRQFFGETDETVNKRAKALIEAGIKPIVCVGETLAEREAGKTMSVVLGQIRRCLVGIPADKMRATVIAYEPVWAIGTGKVATTAQAQEVHAAIRAELVKLYGREVADAVRIQYGGSMKPDNAEELLKQPDIDGGLIGGASLKVDSFTALIEIGTKCSECGL